jgi:hypothetical protein
MGTLAPFNGVASINQCTGFSTHCALHGFIINTNNISTKLIFDNMASGSADPEFLISKKYPTFGY